MPIFKLVNAEENIDNAILIPTTKTNLELEKHLESWLESSPWAIAQEPLIIIGRQTTANTEEYGSIFPDLLGIDKDGNLVIIEFKKGRTPREVIAQLLEYAAWACDLSDEKVHDIAENYLSKKKSEQKLETLFWESFEAEEFPTLNQRLRLFIAAEDIAPSVAKVSRFLRQAHGVDVNCVKFSIFQTKSGEILVNSEYIVGLEDVVSRKDHTKQTRWSGTKTVKEIVWEGVQEFTKGDGKRMFTPKDIMEIIHKKQPEIKKSTIGCQIISDSVNHPSRHHYPGGKDRYWWLEKGKYRLFNPIDDSTN
ncbi:DUF7669 domain-containing protein [Desulfonatronum thioautotrophicum]|uniref:DUF7669 domain-containing protein n=1 Tax=Desulfonatronum thioautotrophicum TaxID=617001 RepID=UPI0005EACB7E|nr:hypothetical protein [Desulfonatronum thioautotrophicum]